jgi:hypothetical protein
MALGHNTGSAVQYMSFCVKAHGVPAFFGVKRVGVSAKKGCAKAHGFV